MKNVHEIEIKLTTEWEKCLDDAFKKKVKETKVDGFRKGACPKDIFIKRFGIESLYMDAVDEAVAVGYKKALEDNKHFKVGQVTGSFGVAERMKAESLRSWYKRADNALYQAKNTGRNRVVDSDKIDIPLVSLQVQWRQEWNCGNDEIDEQHDKILQIAND